MMASVPVCLGYLLTGVALIFIYEGIVNKNEVRTIIIGIIIMSITVSLYEAMAPVYILGVLAILILRTLYCFNEKVNLKNYIAIFFKFMIILAASIVLEAIIAKILISVLHIEKSNLVTMEINWLNGKGFFENFSLLVKSILRNYVYVINNKSLMTFCTAIVISMILAVVLSIRKKTIVVFMIFLGLILSNFSLSIIQGIVSPYRTCLTFSLFIGFIFMILYTRCSKPTFKILLSLFVFILVINQSHELSQRFYNDYKRYCQDKQIAIQTATIINYNYDYNKPIVFLGQIGDYNNIDYGQTNGMSVINWGVGSFEGTGVEMMNFMNMHGYYFQLPSESQVEEAKLKGIDMISYPQKGYIKELDEYIIVKFGEY